MLDEARTMEKKIQQPRSVPIAFDVLRLQMAVPSALTLVTGPMI